jgi:hypothetical protein
MRVKTSITLDEALRRYVVDQARAVRDERDRQILNRASERLNAEMAELLEIQGDI